MSAQYQVAIQQLGVAELEDDLPHPQPFFLERREPELLFPLPRERARERAFAKFTK